MVSNEQMPKDFAELTINNNEHILDQVSSLQLPQSPPVPPARIPPSEMSEKEIHEKTN